jgi:hypothetical protein
MRLENNIVTKNAHHSFSVIYLLSHGSFRQVDRNSGAYVHRPCGRIRLIEGNAKFVSLPLTPHSVEDWIRLSLSFRCPSTPSKTTVNFEWQCCLFSIRITPGIELPVKQSVACAQMNKQIIM